MQSMNDDLTLDMFQPSSSGRTSQESCQPKTTPLDAFLVHLPVKMIRSSRQGANGQTLVVCMAPREQSRGGSLTPNTSEWPNDAGVCSLSQVLETTLIPQRFFLSQKACAGILRRAEKRGKTLPSALELSLRTVGALCADSHPGAYSGQDAYTGRLIPAYAIQGNMIGRSDTAGPQGNGINEEVCFTQNCADRHAVATAMAVRRLTPVECERLQGFPDNYTNIPWRKSDQAPDGPRYKALGNSWAVPVVRWIGKRIAEATK